MKGVRTMLFKKVETNVLEIMLTYGCGAFLIYAVGSAAYQVGRDAGKKEAKKKKRVTYREYYGHHED